MVLSKKVKTALDETRLLILGAQVLLGFQLHGVFQDAFASVSGGARLGACIGQTLMAVSLGLLIAPSMQHRIIEAGADTRRIHRVATLFAGAALVPFGISIGLSMYVVFDHLYGPVPSIIAGLGFCLIAALFWFGLAFALRPLREVKSMHDKETSTPLPTRIDQMLTEARVIIPGGQALLGFQLTVTLTRSFGELPDSVRLLHVGALCCVALAVILLMTPAAIHRITFSGADTPAFFRLGSAFVIAAPALLALGIAGDLYVAIVKSIGAPILAGTVASVVLVVLAILWYSLPLWLRWSYGGRPAG